MKSKATSTLAVLTLTLSVLASHAWAQQPSASPSLKQDATQTQNTTVENGENAGPYMVTSSVEFGYRGLQVVGDLNKFQSDLNYKAGPRLFDSSLFLKSKDGNGGLFDTLLLTSTGWGADPYGQMRISVEKRAWYRFDGRSRRAKYFRFLNTFANPNWVFSPATFNRPPSAVTGEHGFNTRTQLGDFGLTILPKNNLIRFNVGYSPERFAGFGFTNYHAGGNEFLMIDNLRSRANDFRLGADGALDQSTSHSSRVSSISR